MVCALCEKETKLLNSHVIPKFVFNWIRKTSATGYLRRVTNVNQRMQDGLKLKLLCGECEQHFGVFEKLFAEKIFQPYTASIENDFKDHAFYHVEHEEWLLKFIISLQWRAFRYFKFLDGLSFPERNEFETFGKVWHEYLTGARSDTGGSRSYIIFLSSLDNAKGKWMKPFPTNINTYLMRATDCTPVVGKTTLAMYTKIGPIALFTTINPSRLKGLEDSLISKNGVLKTAQEIGNPTIVDFLFHTRPQEVLDQSQTMSDQQKKRFQRATWKIQKKLETL